MIINQLHSIGDLIFLEPLYRYFWKERGEKPIVPVRNHLMWLSQYIESADFRPMSEFIIDYESTKISDDYLPLRWANQILRGYDKNDHHDFENMMLDKYRLAGLDTELWKQIKLFFDPKKATQLMADLGLNDRSTYFLVNEYSQAGKIKIEIDNDLIQRIDMREIPGYTLCDWFFVMFFANEIHTVSTSIIFMLQAIEHLKAHVFIYPRPNEDGLRGISQLHPSFNYKLCQSKQ